MIRFIFGGVLFLGIYVGLNYYIGWHGLYLLEQLEVWHGLSSMEVTYWLLFSLLPLAYPLTRLPFLRGKLEHVLQVIGSWYIAIFYFSLLLLPVVDLLAWLLREALGLEPLVYTLVCAGLYLAVMVSLLVRGSYNARTPVVRKHRLELEKSGDLGTSVPAPGSGSETRSPATQHPVTQYPASGTRTSPAYSLRIAVASDLHLGHLVGRTHLLKLLTIVREMQPDLLLLPGDVVDDDPQAFIDNGLAQIMREIADIPRYGAFAVLGNHEYYGRQIERYVSIMADIGVRVLRDEVVLCGDTESYANTTASRGPCFYIAGRKDHTADQFAGSDQAGRIAHATLLHDIDHSLPVIMMDHQPRQFAAALASGVDLLLSGHTHRGQFAPNHFITRRLFELDWGYMKKTGTHSMHVLVSSGFGTWGPPIRLASRSEVLQIELIFGGKI